MGVLIIALTVATRTIRRDPASLMLLLWVFGILAFASVVNWSVNGRK